MPDTTVTYVDAHAHKRPYSNASVIGPWIYTKGTAGFHPQTGEISLDIREQTSQCMKNLADILAACGATFADVVKVNVYLTDIADRARINPVRQEAFGDVRPASTLVEVSALAVPGAKIEIEAVALLA